MHWAIQVVSIIFDGIYTFSLCNDVCLQCWRRIELYLWCYRFIHFVVLVIHMLAFVETPSSLTWSSDLRQPQNRWTAPCGLLECIELVCLAVLLTDQIIKVSNRSCIILIKLFDSMFVGDVYGFKIGSNYRGI